LLKKRDGGKIDAYIPGSLRKKEKHCDLMNILQTWTHCLLYYKGIYPKDAFTERNLLGLTLPMASAEPLKNYLDDFFDKLRPHIDHLNHLQILIITKEETIV
jgi:hypothetical protein